ncbi:MAG: hypothetical protein ACETWG_01755, partial [Candidatus Neomarinimicrobiota bacterium]
MTGPTSIEYQQLPARERKRHLEHHFAENFESLAYTLLADVYIQENNLERARKVCSIGLDHHPNHAPGLFLLATLALREGRLEEAEELLLQTLKSDEYHLEAAELLVAVQERLHRKKPILEKAYRRLLRANPLSRGAQMRLKRIYAERDLIKEVEQELRARRGEIAAPERERVEPREPARARETEEKEAPAAAVELPRIVRPPAAAAEEAAAEPSWKANIKRLAAIMATTEEKLADVEPWLKISKEEAGLADLAEPVTLPKKKPPIEVELLGDLLETAAVEEKEEKAPGWPKVEAAGEDAGPEGELLDRLGLEHEEKAGELFEPGAVAIGEEEIELEDKGFETTADDHRKQEEETYRTDIEYHRRETERENELIKAAPEREAQEEPFEISPESLQDEDEGAPIKVTVEEGEPEKEPFEPGAVAAEKEEPGLEEAGIETVSVREKKAAEEPYRADEESLRREAEREDEIIGAALPEEETAEEE